MGITVSHYYQCSNVIQEEIQKNLYVEFEEDFTKHGGHRAFLKSLQEFGDWRESQKVLFVGIDSVNTFLGTVSIEYARDSLLTPCIANVFVHPLYRNKGYGKLLVKFAEKYIKKKGLSTSYLWCKKELELYYEKMGYKPVGLPKSMDMGDETIFMGKSLQ
jgi:GNAT superfamily N-acetyltransferase